MKTVELLQALSDEQEQTGGSVVDVLVRSDVPFEKLMAAMRWQANCLAEKCG